MKIAYDAKRALNNATGLGNHARILLNALMRDYPDNEYLLLSPKAKDEFFHQLHGEFKLQFPETKLDKLLPSFWRSYSISNQVGRSRIDVYHGLSNELPFNIHRSGAASVVTIHDLIFLKHKEQYPWIDRQSYELKTRYAAKHANHIIAVSEETKRDVMEYYQVDERQISVIYPSVDTKFYTKVSDGKLASVREKYQLPEKYILNVGSFFPRKNQVRLIEAFDRIRNDIDEDLILAGSSGTMLSDIQKIIQTKGLEERVKTVANISNDDMPAVYQLSGLFVFPSLFEGFGAPVLEALFSGVPVIASAGGAIAEAAGAGSAFANPNEAEDIAKQMLRVLKDKSLQQSMIQEGMSHAQSMTDKVFAKKTMNVYKMRLGLR